MSESLSSHTTEPGRIARDTTQANQTGWKRWLPGLNTLRAYESSWLRHDLVAGLVMTTMLVPGPDSARAAVILTVVLPFSAGEPQRAVAVVKAAGAKTQLTSVVGALAIALLLVLSPELLQHLPHAALAAVVIATAIGLSGRRSVTIRQFGGARDREYCRVSETKS